MDIFHWNSNIFIPFSVDDDRHAREQDADRGELGLQLLDLLELLRTGRDEKEEEEEKGAAAEQTR